MGEYLNLQIFVSLSLCLSVSVHVSSEVVYGVAPYHGLCMLALTLKEHASASIRNLIPKPLKLKKVKDDSYAA